MKKVVYLFSILIFLVLASSFAFAAMLNISWLDAVYFVIVSFTTVGYGDLLPINSASKILIIFLLPASHLIIALIVVELGKGFVLNILGRTGMDRRKNFANHVIVCDYEFFGHIIAPELQQFGLDFVIVEEKEDIVKEIREETPYFVVHGNPKKEEALERAGIDRAATLITAFSDDADNVFTIITAKSLNEKLKIISMGSSHENVDKLIKVGADDVILPKVVVGKVVARMIVQPGMLARIENLCATRSHRVSLVSVTQEMAGKAISTLPHEPLAILRGDEIIEKPEATETLQVADRLIMVTDEEDMDGLPSPNLE